MISPLKWACAFGLMAVIVSCGGEAPKRQVPNGVLQKDSMAYYLSQIHVVDAAMRHREVRKQSLQSYAKRGFIEYFDTAQVSRDRFLKSLEFWSEDCCTLLRFITSRNDLTTTTFLSRRNERSPFVCDPPPQKERIKERWPRNAKPPS